jgi:cell division protein FtsW
MAFIARTDRSVLGRWWWTVDRWTLVCLILLTTFGLLLSLTASPPVAKHIGFEPLHFVRRHAAYLPAALAIMIIVSLQQPRQIRRLGVILFAVSLLLLATTAVFGIETKGATRWLIYEGFSIQPSEFVKPTFAIVAAWMFAAQRLDEGIPGNLISSILMALILSLLIAQPDIGQSGLIAVVWFSQWFLAGLPMIWVAALGAIGVAGLISSYFIFSHVASRIDRFLDPAVGDSYQIDRAFEAFTNGGLLGRGPGEGTIKARLPDAHSDFIFAVVGEEFGLLACMVIVAMFTFIVLRGYVLALRDENLFVVLAVSGLLAQFGLQALINMASVLSLMPTKGMTLPFVSYGGSSMMALALTMGMALGLTRRRVGTNS